MNYLLSIVVLITSYLIYHGQNKLILVLYCLTLIAIQIWKIYNHLRVKKAVRYFIADILLNRNNESNIYCRKYKRVNDTKYMLYNVVSRGKFFDYGIMNVDYNSKSLKFDLYGSG